MSFSRFINTQSSLIQRLTFCKLIRPLHICPAILYQKEQKRTNEIDVSRERPYEHLSFGQKVVRAGTDLTYALVIICGVGITGILLYTISSELFKSDGPNAVYSAAFKRCQDSGEVLDALGDPLKAYGEVSRRGRRQHIQHGTFMKDGIEITRVKFHLQGQFRSAVVYSGMYKGTKGKLQFEHLIVELEGYPPKTIVLETSGLPMSSGSPFS